MDTNNQNKGTIKLSDETKDELKSFGTMGESYEDVIKRLIFMVRKNEFKNAQAISDKELGRKL